MAHQAHSAGQVGRLCEITSTDRPRAPRCSVASTSGRTGPARRVTPGRCPRLAGSGTGAAPAGHGTPPAGFSGTAAPVPPSPPELGHGMAEDWPLQSFLELGALPGAVPCARLHTRHVLWEWGLTALRDDTELLVSELVTNAVHASQSMEWIFPVRMRLLSDRAQVAIVVWDTNPQPPVRTEAGEDDETGRGLILVDAISERWDWNATPDTGGKVVWCVVTALSRSRPGPTVGPCRCLSAASRSAWPPPGARDDSRRVSTRRFHPPGPAG